MTSLAAPLNPTLRHPSVAARPFLVVAVFISFLGVVAAVIASLRPAHRVRTLAEEVSVDHRVVFAGTQDARGFVQASAEWVALRGAIATL